MPVEANAAGAIRNTPAKAEQKNEAADGASSDDATSEKNKARHLALEYWGNISTLSAAEFKLLIEKLAASPLIGFEKLPAGSVSERRGASDSEKFARDSAELIARACSLIFQLTASGGLLVAQPVQKLEKIAICSADAGAGFVRWAAGGKPVKLGERKFFHASGRINLLAYLRFRLAKRSSFAAKEGDLLLPKMTEKIIAAAIPRLPWLKNISRRRATWTGIYKRWLLHVFELCGVGKETVSFADITEMAAWHLNQNLREPTFIVEIRRGGFGTAPLPAREMSKLIPGYDAVLPVRVGATPPDEEDGDEENASDALIAGEQDLEVEKDYEIAVKKLREWTRNLVDRQNLPRQQAIKEAVELASSSAFGRPATEDFRLLLEWLAYRLKRKKETEDRKEKSEENKKKPAKRQLVYNTVFSYASRLQFLVRAFKGTRFSELDTDDFAEFLESYATSAAAKAYKSVAMSFHGWLRNVKQIPVKEVEWTSRKLFFTRGAHEWTLITEREFQRAISEASASFDELTASMLRVALLLLRRAGLRCAEAVALEVRSFRRPSGRKLKIRKSKTAAGRRALPLNLLLSDAEQREVLSFVENLAKDNPKTYSLLFTDSDGKPLKPGKLGKLIERVFKKAGIKNQSAHGLRHAFVGSLVAKWWIQANSLFERNADASSETVKGWARRALEKEYAGGVISDRTIKELDDVRVLLGHASLKITFERYVHLTDIIVADSIWQTEQLQIQTKTEPRISTIELARLAGTTDDAVYRKFQEKYDFSPGGQAASISLFDAEEWLRSRLR